DVYKRQGKKYVFKAETSLPYRGMDVKLNGFFTLPDGSIVQGDTAEYVPSDTDLNQATVETKYTTWIEGYRDQGAEASHSLRSRVWQYVWPSFGMQVRKNADVAPATITASVRPIAFNGKLEEPTYEWELPEGAVIQDQRQDIVRSFVINEPGDYNIKVTVRDARGHETVIEQPLKIGQAEPYAIDLQYSGSNKYEREPLDVLLRPYISGGHPRDRISTRVYSVDGTPLESSGYYGRATLGAGEHSIKLKITSEMGHEAEGEVNINVAENKLPACSLSSRETVGSWIVYANCEDTDGRMKSYEWTIAGELQSISSDRVTISKGTYETMPTISLVGVDDSGGKSEAVTMN
ncbi:PKD domain-containing protein, partial [Klebsiella pneumoniae]|uniref:PKD domain-containing protein n=1 Tax=Klebsiella pneumoniae TaxID=573 RepID=UPI000B30F91C